MSVRRWIAVGAVVLLGGVAPLTASAHASSVPAAKAVLKALPLGCNAPIALGQAHCYAKALGINRPNASSSPTSGLSPTDVQNAYQLPHAVPGTPNGPVVAIVDAYDDKTAEADLATYRSYYGLPACTTANGCFKKVNQNGVQGSYPANDVGWATEITLDLDAVSAACPSCKILLVEATSNSNANLYAAVDRAFAMGAKAISNSYGGAESSAETSDDAHFNHPGTAITVSSGDSGYGVEYPAASRYVTAVGGTSLTGSGTTWTESAWSGAGSGCSAYEAKQSWQTDPGCGRRTVADVSAVADPNTGLAIYDSNCNLLGQLQGTCFKGWGQVGGTSLSSPIIGAVYALAGNTGAITYGSYPYSHTAGLFDVTTGNNGSCSSSYLCTAKPGYDGPTGVGSPRGTSGF